MAENKAELTSVKEVAPRQEGKSDFVLTLDRIPEKARPRGEKLVRDTRDLADKSEYEAKTSLSTVEQTREEITRGELLLSSPGETEQTNDSVIDLEKRVVDLERARLDLLHGKIPAGLLTEEKDEFYNPRTIQAKLAKGVRALRKIINNRARQDGERQAISDINTAVAYYNGRLNSLYREVYRMVTTPEVDGKIEDLSVDEDPDQNVQILRRNYQIAGVFKTKSTNVRATIGRLAVSKVVSTKLANLTIDYERGGKVAEYDPEDPSAHPLGSEVRDHLENAEEEITRVADWVEANCRQKSSNLLLNTLDKTYGEIVANQVGANEATRNALGSHRDADAFLTEEFVEQFERISRAAAGIESLVRELKLEKDMQLVGSNWAQEMRIKFKERAERNERLGRNEDIFTHMSGEFGNLDTFESIMKSHKILSHRSAIKEGVPTEFSTGVSSGFHLIMTDSGLIVKDTNGSVWKSYTWQQYGQLKYPSEALPLNSLKAGGVFHEFDQVLVDINHFFLSGANTPDWAIVMPARFIRATEQLGHYEQDGISVLDKNFDSDKNSPEDKTKGFPPGNVGASLDLNEIPFVICVGERARPQIDEWIEKNPNSLPGKKTDGSIEDWKTKHVVNVNSLNEGQSVNIARRALFDRFEVPIFRGVETPTGNSADSPGYRADLPTYIYREI